MLGESLGGQAHRGDELARSERRVEVGAVAGQAVELGDRDGSLASGSRHPHDGLQGRQGDAHIGWVRGDAGIAVPEDRVIAVVPFDGRAAAPRLALVARRGGVVEVGAAGPLHQVAARRRHVAELGGRTRQDGPGQQGVVPLDPLVVGDVRVRHERPDLEPAVVAPTDLAQVEAVDVDQPRRPLDVLLHEVEQVGAAGDEPGPDAGGDVADGRGHVIGR